MRASCRACRQDHFLAIDHHGSRVFLQRSARDRSMSTVKLLLLLQIISHPRNYEFRKSKIICDNLRVGCDIRIQIICDELAYTKLKVS